MEQKFIQDKQGNKQLPITHMNAVRDSQGNTLTSLLGAFEDEVRGLVSTPHQEYVTVATYSALPASGSEDTIYRVSNYDGSQSQVSAGVYSEYAWNGTQYVFLRVNSAAGEVFDITEYNSNTKYANLAAALGTNGANIPQSLRKGGMSVKFVQSSDNKYIQFRYMSSSTAVADFTNVANWQGEDDIPTAGSENLVKSGGVFAKYNDIDIDKMSFAESKNLYNPNDENIVEHYYQYRKKLDYSEDYYVTGYIKVDSGQTYMFSYQTLQALTARFVALFDENVEFLSYSANISSITISSDNVKYIRLSLPMNIKGQNIQVEKGSVITAFSAYNPIINRNVLPEIVVPENSVGTSQVKDNAITGNKIGSFSVSSEKIHEDAVAINQVSFVDKGKNLFDVNSPNIQLGKYETTRVWSNPDYNLSDYIPVTPGLTYKFSYNGTAQIVRFVSVFNAQCEIQQSYLENINEIIIPNGIYYIRISQSATLWNKLQVEQGDTVSSWEAYYRTIKKNVLPSDLNSLLSQPLNATASALGVLPTKSAGNLSAGGTLQVTDQYPYYCKNRQNISFYAKLTTMGTLYIGKGYQTFLGKYIKIDNTNITTVTCDLNGNETLGTPVAHGLTFSDFIKVVISVQVNGTAKIILQSLAGENTSITSSYWENAAGRIFVKSVDFVGTECVLSAIHGEMKKPVWVCGDSYLSNGDANRWPYYISQFGIDNPLYVAYSGADSRGIYLDIQYRALKFATPKYIVWCLGMNNASDTDASTPSAGWLEYVTKLQALCAEKNITLILATIPCTATLNHEGKNAWVKASGHRYIDFAKAVNGQTFTQGTLNWFAGYNADGIHPTALGAQALASQVMIDFPEILQYLSEE